MKFINLFLFLLINFTSATTQKSFTKQEYDLSYLQKTIYQLLNDTLRSNIIWDRLAEMTDLYGHRMTGSKSLEDSIDWIKKEMKKDGLKVFTQKVTANLWQRNEESLIYHSPTRGDVQLEMLGLGNSIGTPKHGITGEIVSVKSRDDLNQRGENGEIKGKIILCNFPWSGYGEAAFARQNCAILGEKYGAIAALVRSATPFSLDTPHTGAMLRAKIAGAAISVEDAQMLTRIEARASKANFNSTIFVKPILTLKMGATFKHNGAKTRNLIAEIKGREKPEEIVLISGHIDSWDIGVGAMDDAAGAFVGWEALRQISKLNISPRRTIRVVMWANEEAGAKGGLTYYKKYKNDLESHVLAMESDTGTFEPDGFLFDGNEEATKLLKEIGIQLLGHTSFGNIKKSSVSPPDLHLLCKCGIPCASLHSISPNNYTLNYFTFHHSKADRMEVLNPHQLARNAAMIAGFIYPIAEIEKTLPKYKLKD